jgi:hypothetical protein
VRFAPVSLAALSSALFCITFAGVSAHAQSIPPSASGEPAAPASVDTAPAANEPASSAPAPADAAASADAAVGVGAPQATTRVVVAADPTATASETGGPDDQVDAGASAELGWPQLVIHGRIRTGYEVERVHPDASQPPVADGTEPGFFLDQARVELKAEMHERLRAVISFDVDSGVQIRNAYVNWRPKKVLQLRAGRFRRPFSRLANQSIGSLPFRARGLYDERIMEDEQWGDRALGFMVHGKMSPAAIGSGVEGADVIVRAEYKPLSFLELGLGAAHKWTERFEDGPNLSLNGVSVDVATEIDGFYAAVEGSATQNPNPPPVSGDASLRTPWAVGVIGYAGYYAELIPALLLGPVGVFEWTDTDTSYGQDESVRAVLGMSLTFHGEALRVMPQVEVIRPVGKVGARSEVAAENYYVLVSTGL